MVVIAKTEDDLIKQFIEWKDSVENIGMRVSHTYTQPFYCPSGICPGPPG